MRRPVVLLIAAGVLLGAAVAGAQEAPHPERVAAQALAVWAPDIGAHDDDAVAPAAKVAGAPRFRTQNANVATAAAPHAKRNRILAGAAVGFGIGAVLGVSIGAEACLNEPRWHCAVKGGVTIGALGAFIGWLRP